MVHKKKVTLTYTSSWLSWSRSPLSSSRSCLACKYFDFVLHCNNSLLASRFEIQVSDQDQEENQMRILPELPLTNIRILMLKGFLLKPSKSIKQSSIYVKRNLDPWSWDIDPTPLKLKILKALAVENCQTVQICWRSPIGPICPNWLWSYLARLHLGNLFIVVPCKITAADPNTLCLKLMIGKKMDLTKTHKLLIWTWHSNISHGVIQICQRRVFWVCMKSLWQKASKYLGGKSREATLHLKLFICI